MYHIYKAIHDRMYKFLMAETKLTNISILGSKTLLVENPTHFGFQGLNHKDPKIILMDDDTTGYKINNGYEGGEIVSVDSKLYNKTITIKENLLRNWDPADNAYIQRTPGGVVVNQVAIGDLSVVTKFPTICVVPGSESLDWFCMPGGTKETISINFMIYVEDGDSESATEELLLLTNAVKWILMSNLHIQLAGEDSIYGVTSKAIVSNIDYGVIQKGSEFLKSSKLTWTGEIFVMRDYLLGNNRAPYEGFYDKKN